MKTKSRASHFFSPRRLFMAALMLIIAGPESRRAHSAEGPNPALVQLSSSAALAYEQGQFASALEAYGKILETGRVSPALLFNAGNAALKAGQAGRAISFYLRAQPLAPRDPDIAANLAFARNSVGSPQLPPPALWHRLVSRLTLDEWGWLLTGSVWISFSLLTLILLFPAWPGRPILKSAATMLFLLLLGSGSALMVRLVHEKKNVIAVALRDNTGVRYGPLEASRISFYLKDGRELKVLNQRDGWLQVRDGAGRAGWVKPPEVAVVRGPG